MYFHFLLPELNQNYYLKGLNVTVKYFVLSVFTVAVLKSVDRDKFLDMLKGKTRSKKVK